jgi:Icc-related predicted phosphoesterase
MIILIVGDTHGQVECINRYYRLLNTLGLTPNFCLQAGDFGFEPKNTQWPYYVSGELKLPCPTYIIHGNHDHPTITDEVMYGKVKVTDAHVFKWKGEIIELTHDNESINVFGVGGAPCVDVPAYRYPFHPSEFNDAHEIWLKAGAPRIDILLTHEAPTGTGAIGEVRWGNPLTCGIPQLRKLWETIRPKWQIGGHYHKYHVYHEDDLNHMILPLSWDGAMVINTNGGDWQMQLVTFQALEQLIKKQKDDEIV